MARDVRCRGRLDAKFGIHDAWGTCCSTFDRSVSFEHERCNVKMRSMPGSGAWKTVDDEGSTRSAVRSGISKFHWFTHSIIRVKMAQGQMGVESGMSG